MPSSKNDATIIGNSKISAVRVIGLASCLVWFGVSGFIESSPIANQSDLYTFVVLSVVLFSSACFPRLVERFLMMKFVAVVCALAAAFATMLPFLFPGQEFTVFAASLGAGCGLSALLLMWGMMFSSIGLRSMIAELLLAQLLMSLLRLLCDLAPLLLGSSMRAGFVVVSGCCFAYLAGRGGFGPVLPKGEDGRESHPVALLAGFVVATNLWALAINQLYNIYRFCSPLDFSSLSPIAIILEIAFIVAMLFLSSAKKVKENHFYLVIAGFTLVAFLLLPIFGLGSPVPFLVLFVGFSALSLLTWILSARVVALLKIHPVTVYGCSLGSFLGLQIAIARLSAPGFYVLFADIPASLSILCLGGVVTVLIAYYLMFRSQLLGGSTTAEGDVDGEEDRGDVFDGWEGIVDRCGLTQREGEVVLLFAKGRSYARIQEILCISRGTVNFHMSNAYRKLNVSNRQELLDLVERGEQPK